MACQAPGCRSLLDHVVKGGGSKGGRCWGNLRELWGVARHLLTYPLYLSPLPTFGSEGDVSSSVVAPASFRGSELVLGVQGFVSSFIGFCRVSNCFMGFVAWLGRLLVWPEHGFYRFKDENRASCCGEL